MPIIKSKNPTEFVQKRYRFEKHLSEEVTMYCEWANIKNDNQFFEEAALYVLKKDKDWQQAKNKLSKKSELE